MSKKLLDDDSLSVQSQNGHNYNLSEVELDKERGEHPKVCRCCCFDVYPIIMLFCICFVTFGSYWVYDTPGAIQTQLTSWFGHNYTKDKNALLYSIYSWPNVILPLWSGFIVDKVTGIRFGALLFCTLILIGQAIFAMGVQYEMYWIAFAGRFVFGLGGESLTVAQNSFTIRWFEGPNLALAFGVVVSIARIGSSVNFALTPTLTHKSVPFAVWFGFGTCLASFITCWVAYFGDKWGEDRVEHIQVLKRQKQKEEADNKTERNRISHQIATDAIKSSAEGYSEQLLNEVNMGLPIEEEVGEKVISLKDILKLPAAAWILFIITLFFYVGVFVFYQVASDVMQNTGRKYSPDTASLFMSIPNFISIVASPFFGWVVDKYGRALMMICIACFMMIVGHVVFLAVAEEWVFIHPIIFMTWFGFAYSLGAACLWPILSLVVQDDLVSTGYGTMTAVQNLGLAVFPIIVGVLQTHVKNLCHWFGMKPCDMNLQYTVPIIVFIICEAIALILTFVEIGLDKSRHQGRMNMSAAQRLHLQMNGEDFGESGDPFGKKVVVARKLSLEVHAR